MTGDLRSFLKDAERLGFIPIGHDGRGHIRLENRDTGQRYSTGSTPGDHRSRRNALADLERLSGRRLPRVNAGHHRHRRQAQLCTELSPTEAERSREIDDLAAEADVLCSRFAELVATPSRAAAAEARLVLQQHGRHPPAVGAVPPHHRPARLGQARSIARRAPRRKSLWHTTQPGRKL
jgi:hypothetical protein